MRLLLIAAIRFYRRFVSPHKGFRCAWAAHTGHASCSAFGLRAVEREGAWRGLALIRRHTRRCGGHARLQRGHCDLGCAPDCAGASADCTHWQGLSCCDLFSCCDAPGRRDEPARQRKRRQRPEPAR